MNKHGNLFSRSLSFVSKIKNAPKRSTNKDRWQPDMVSINSDINFEVFKDAFYLWMVNEQFNSLIEVQSFHIQEFNRMLACNFKF